MTQTFLKILKLDENFCSKQKTKEYVLLKFLYVKIVKANDGGYHQEEFSQKIEQITKSC